jgi:hypothetical protein
MNPRLPAYHKLLGTGGLEQFLTLTGNFSKMNTMIRIIRIFFCNRHLRTRSAFLREVYVNIIILLNSFLGYDKYDVIDKKKKNQKLERRLRQNRP